MRLGTDGTGGSTFQGFQFGLVALEDRLPVVYLSLELRSTLTQLSRFPSFFGCGRLALRVTTLAVKQLVVGIEENPGGGGSSNFVDDVLVETPRAKRVQRENINTKINNLPLDSFYEC